ncbi:unnamed protein product, partial [Prorocentrum cordatum]
VTFSNDAVPSPASEHTGSCEQSWAETGSMEDSSDLAIFQLETLRAASKERNPLSPGLVRSSEREESLMLKQLRRQNAATIGNLRDLEMDQIKHDEAPAAFQVLQSIVGHPRFVAFWAVAVVLNIVVMIAEEEQLGMRMGAQLGFYKRYGTDEYMSEWWPSFEQLIFGSDVAFVVLFSVGGLFSSTRTICAGPR